MISPEARSFQDRLRKEINDESLPVHPGRSRLMRSTCTAVRVFVGQLKDDYIIGKSLSVICILDM